MSHTLLAQDFSYLLDDQGSPIAQSTFSLDQTAKACSLFLKAIEQRRADAAVDLATRYLESNRPAEACYWLLFAGQLGSGEASAKAASLQTQVTTEAAEHARKLFAPAKAKGPTIGNLNKELK